MRRTLSKDGSQNFQLRSFADDNKNSSRCYICKSVYRCRLRCNEMSIGSVDNFFSFGSRSPIRKGWHLGRRVNGINAQYIDKRSSALLRTCALCG